MCPVAGKPQLMTVMCNRAPSFTQVSKYLYRESFTIRKISSVIRFKYHQYQISTVLSSLIYLSSSTLFFLASTYFQNPVFSVCAKQTVIMKVADRPGDISILTHIFSSDNRYNIDPSELSLNLSEHTIDLTMTFQNSCGYLVRNQVKSDPELFHRLLFDFSSRRKNLNSV